jgi:hypothetical protein
MLILLSLTQDRILFIVLLLKFQLIHFIVSHIIGYNNLKRVTKGERLHKTEEGHAVNEKISCNMKGV